MAKLNKKTFNKVIEEFKNSHFISDALDKVNVNAVDFYIYLDENEDAKLEFEKVEQYINLYLEDRIAKISYTLDKPNAKILLDMIKVRNKKRYIVKEDKVSDTMDELSYEELLNLAADLEKQMKNL